MVDKTNSNVWLATALILVVLVAGLFIASGSIKDAIEEKSDVVVPSAQEIADLVVIPEVVVPEWEAPVIPEFESDNKVNDLWEDLYSGVIAVLKGNATEDAEAELEDLINEAEKEEDGDLFDFLKLNILNFDEVDDVDFEEEDVEVTVLELGLEDKEDKVAQVVFELEVTYTLTEGPSNDYYEKTVFATANVVYEEGDFGEEDVELSFLLE